MSRIDPQLDPGKEPEDINRNKRDLVKSASGLLFMASLGLPVASSALTSSTDDSPPATPQLWGDPATLVSAIAAGTLAVADVTETVEAYTRGFGYVVLWRGKIPEDTARFWNAPAMANREAAIVGPPGHANGLIRIVELGDDFQRVDYHQTLGWIALEIRVTSPDSLVEELKGLPFVHTGGPGTFSSSDGTPVYRAAQFEGPSGEPLYMTQHMQLDELLPNGPNNVGPLFIQTLAARPYPQTRDFYLNMLAMKSRMEIDVPRKKLAEQFNLPSDKRYKMAAFRTPDFCSIQIDEYPDVIKQRPAADGCLVPGACMSSFFTRDLGPIAATLRQAKLPFTETDSYAMLPSSGGRAIICRGYAGELVEFIET